MRPWHALVGVVEVVALLMHALQHQPLHPLVGVQPDYSAAQAGHHLLAGGKWGRVVDHAAQRNHAALRGPEVFLLGLTEPQRAQTQRVHREHALVAVARDDRRRTLRQRPAARPQPDIRALEAGAEVLDLAQNGRKHALDGFQQAHALGIDVACQHPVEVLAVGAAGQGQPELVALLAKPVNGVDLAVVRQKAERLHLLEC